ncbi:MAG: hypothetical protein ACRDXX_06565 [Stackebrandtia sp.]
MNDQFKDDLSFLANSVKTPDLRDRVRQGSRRLGIQRTLVGGAAALALVVAGTTGAMAIVDQTADHVAPPADEEVELPDLGEPTELTDLDGTLYYIDADHKQVKAMDSDGYAADALRTDLEGEEYETVNVSPDGRHVSGVSPEGDFWVQEIAAEAEARMIAPADFEAAQCMPPAWAPDSERVFMEYPAGSSEYGFFDVETEEFQYVATIEDACQARVAASVEGDLIAFVEEADDGARIRMIDGHGDTVATIDDQALEDDGLSDFDISSLAALSPSGRHVCLDNTEGAGFDEYRPEACGVVVDVATSEVLSQEGHWGPPLLPDDVNVLQWGVESDSQDRATGLGLYTDGLQEIDRFAEDFDPRYAVSLAFVPDES